MTLMEADINTFYKGIQREPRPLEQQHHTLLLSFMEGPIGNIQEAQTHRIISDWMKHA